MKLIYYIFIFFLLFPFVRLYDFGTDIQPYALVLSIVLVLKIKPKLVFPILLYLVIFISSLLVFLIDPSNPVNSMRSIANYASLFFISYSLYWLVSKKIELVLLEKIIKFSLYVWLSAGLLQILVDRELLDFIISVRTTDNRGVTGLAPEPTFYGMILLFYGLILYLLNKNNIIHVFFCLVGILFLAKSSMALLYVISILVISIALQKNIKIYHKVLIVALSFPLVFFAVGDQDTRLGYIVSSLLKDPMALLEIDASIGDRISHLILSFKGFFDNFTMPHGYNSSQSYFVENAWRFKSLNTEWLSTGGRIMSGYGAAFFELGFFSLLIPLSSLYLFKKNYKRKHELVFHILSINIIMLSAIQLANTFFILYSTLVILKTYET